MEDDHNVIFNLTTSIVSNGTTKTIIQPKTIKIKAIVVAQLGVT
jgi:hypothetical protein